MVQKRDRSSSCDSEQLVGRAGAEKEEKKAAQDFSGKILVKEEVTEKPGGNNGSVAKVAAPAESGKTAEDPGTPSKQGAAAAAASESKGSSHQDKVSKLVLSRPPLKAPDVFRREAAAAAEQVVRAAKASATTAAEARQKSPSPLKRNAQASAGLSGKSRSPAPRRSERESRIAAKTSQSPRRDPEARAVALPPEQTGDADFDFMFNSSAPQLSTADRATAVGFFDGAGATDMLLEGSGVMRLPDQYVPFMLNGFPHGFQGLAQEDAMALLNVLSMITRSSSSSGTGNSGRGSGGGALAPLDRYVEVRQTLAIDARGRRVMRKSLVVDGEEVCLEEKAL